MSKKPQASNRIFQVNSELRTNIYEIIKSKLDLNPSVIVTVSEVSCSPDLKHATAYISVYTTDEEKKRETFEKIKNNSGKVRFFLGRMMTTRTVPEVEFVIDGSYDYGNKIDQIISTFTYGEDDDKNKWCRKTN